MVDMPGGVTQKTHVTVSLDQLQNLEKSGQQLTFETPQQAQEYRESLAAAKTLGGDTVLTIPKPTNFEQLGLTDVGLKKAFDSVDINLTEIFSMLHEMGVEMRKAGKEARQATRESEQAELKASAEKIRSAAHLAMVAGIVGGATQIAGGVVSLGFTAKAFSEMNAIKPASTQTDLAQSMGQLKSELGATGRPRANAIGESTLKDSIANLKAQMQQPKIDPIALQSASTRAQNFTNLGTASSQIWQGVGGIASSAVQYFSKLEEADKALIDAEAARFNAQVQDETEIINNLKEMINDVRSKLSEILQTQNQAASKIWS